MGNGEEEKIMNRRNDTYLVKKCPNLFADRYASLYTTAMCWGFDCGDGWYSLLKDACLKLEPLIIEYKAKYIGESNPCPTFLIQEPVWSIRHPICTYRVLSKWLKGKIWPETVDPWWPRATQIKEKYGTLRFYMSSQTDEMSAIIDNAERQSSVTCETCGKPGKLRGRGWFYTACKQHIREDC